jgi:hypothetical protein
VLTRTVLVIGGMLTAAVLVWAVLDLVRSGDTGSPGRVPAPPSDCTNTLSLYFGHDKEMRVAANLLRSDSRIGRLESETSRQAVERFREILGPVADAPAPYPVPRVPAAVHLTAAAEIDRARLASELRREVPSVDDVEPADCSLRSKLALQCQDGTPAVDVYFDSDELMLAAAAELGGDRRVRAIEQEARATAYQRLKKTVADEPDALVTLQPGDVRAALRLTPARRIDAGRLADDLETELPEADRVHVAACPKTARQLSAAIPRVSCFQRITLVFSFDEDLQRAAKALKKHDGMAKLRTTTREQAYQRMQETFQDDFAILPLIDPAELPPFAQLTATDGVDTEVLAARLRTDFPAADRVIPARCPAMPHPVVGR